MQNLFDLTGKTALITGGGGVLCSAMALVLAQHGARVVLMGRGREKLESAAANISASVGHNCASFVQGDVLNATEVQKALDEVHADVGDIHILLNGAGGTHAKATTGPTTSMFDLDFEAMRYVLDLNYMGTVIPSFLVAKEFVARGEGVVINIASMSSYKPLTRNIAYSAGKAAAKNFTEWLAVHMAQHYSPNIRVNAIAPGFFLAEQNRHFILDEQGNYTPRAQSMLQRTPMNKLGDAMDLGGAAVFLASAAARFVTGVTIAVDGGVQAMGAI
jgi:NAD(P)-dependent dehydrogenase (short-subunit alcohol dehydrogenase family)